MSSPSPARLPEGFLWGTATASYQVEGAVEADGRSRSIWDTFSHTPGATRHGDTGDRACDHYHRLEEDLDLVAELGLRAYRFSVAWPRVQPEGKGPANPAGLDFYRRLVEGLRRRGVVPVATLYHWDLPQVLEDQGGWTNRDTAERFGEMVSLVADALEGAVGRWITLNEPWCSAWLGYGLGTHAPGHRDLEGALRATHHLLLAHGRAVAALRAAGGTPVGITLNLAPKHPASGHEADVAAARRADGNLNRLFLDPVLRGAYPQDMVEYYGGHEPGLAVAQAGDLEAIAAPIDFLGVNYYMTDTLADPGRLGEARTAGYVVARSEAAPEHGAVGVGNPGAARTEMGWEIDPEGLTEILVRLKDEYGNPPVYITENGRACADYVDPEGAVHDPERIAYLEDHVRALHRAVQAGADVRGYFVWSLMDNFEWGEGYSKRFGLVYVDYPTGTRIPKDSFRWYREVVAANGLA